MLVEINVLKFQVCGGYLLKLQIHDLDVYWVMIYVRNSYLWIVLKYLINLEYLRWLTWWKHERILVLDSYWIIQKWIIVVVINWLFYELH